MESESQNSSRKQKMTKDKYVKPNGHFSVMGYE